MATFVKDWGFYQSSPRGHWEAPEGQIWRGRHHKGKVPEALVGQDFR